MAPVTATKTVPERLAAIETGIDGLKELLVQRIEVTERSVSRLYWIGGVLFTALFGVFIEHIFTR